MEEMGEIVEDAGLRARIGRFLEGKYTAATRKRVMRIIGGFPTVTAFCEASDAERLAKYRDARPNSNVDLGEMTMKAIDAVLAYVTHERAEERKAEEMRRHEEEEAQRKEAEAKAKEARENPRFTFGEIKALANFMDLCSIKELDLRRIKDFMSAIGVSIKEMA